MSRRECRRRPSSRLFNAHNPGDGGSGLVQPVFRSPARIPAAESTPEDCAPRRQAKNAIRYQISKAFTADVPKGNEYRYKQTIAINESLSEVVYVGGNFPEVPK